MHKHEDHIELIRLSLYVPPTQTVVQQNDSINPQQLDRELDGMGSTFSNENGNFSESMWPLNISQAELSSEVQAAPMAYVSVASCGMSSSSKPRVNITGQSNVADFGSLSPRSQPPRPRPKTSNAPQTKAQQTEAAKQRKALEKLSGAIATQRVDSPSQVFDLEDAIRRILSSQNSDLTKRDAIKAIQAMSTLIKNSPYQQSRRTAQHGFVSDPKVCDVCGQAVARECDLRKHMKRHEKPFGCTYPKCHKRFGAKSDWKRHENSQHFQLEAYRCKDCGEHFLRVEKFETHLRSKHGTTDPSDLEEEKKSRKIGKNCQGQFWCGFCEDVVRLKQRRNAAWDERFDHIAAHFQKEKIDEWVCAEENKKKHELLRDMDRYVFDDDDERPRAANDMDEMPETASSAPQLSPVASHVAQPSVSRKRKEPEESSSPEPRKRRRHGTQPQTSNLHDQAVQVRYCVSVCHLSTMAATDKCSVNAAMVLMDLCK